MIFFNVLSPPLSTPLHSLLSLYSLTHISVAEREDPDAAANIYEPVVLDLFGLIGAEREGRGRREEGGGGRERRGRRSELLTVSCYQLSSCP